jgi:hypothetical protein
MAKQHRHKMIPTAESFGCSLCSGLLHGSLELRSRKYLEHLIQDAAKSLHGAESSF